MQDKEYKQFGEMSFDVRTPDEICKILERYNTDGEQQRVRIYYGDTDTGRCWMEENDTIGYIGRSTGKFKVSLLIKNSNSLGGGAILDHCIVKITADHYPIYQHPKFNMPEVTVNDLDVLFDDEIYAHCNSSKQATRLAEFMLGERNCK